jgi:hypothetical protein
MKIKTKKRLSPEEYAKYMIDKHGVAGLESKLINDDIIDASKRYTLTFELNPVSMEEMSDTGFENKEFIIEIEEELTEDTVIPQLVELYEDTLRSSEGSNEILVYENTSIRIAKDEDECPSRAFYIINDDMTMMLIWKNGRLVK